MSDSRRLAPLQRWLLAQPAVYSFVVLGCGVVGGYLVAVMATGSWAWGLACACGLALGGGGLLLLAYRRLTGR